MGRSTSQKRFAPRSRRSVVKLLEFHVERYRSLKNVTWKPGDLNVVIGPNGSGKTNLVRALELMAVSARGELEKQVNKEGGMIPMSWDGNPLGGIAWSVTLVRLPTEIAYLDFWGPQEKRFAAAKYELVLGSVLSPSLFSISISRETLEAYWRLNTDQTVKSEKILVRDPDGGMVWYTNRSQLERVEPRNLPDESLLSKVWGLRAEADYFRDSLRSWSIHPTIVTGENSEMRQAAVTRNEKVLASDGQNLPSVLHTLCNENRRFEEEIQRAMNAAFGDAFEKLVFPPASDQRIQLGIRWKHLDRPQTASDLSDGTLRFLFLVAALANPQPPPLIVIEEPEIGLHPSMLPIIADYAADAATRTQVIFTTHSPQFLNAFRDTIPTTTVCLWQNGETVLRVLDGKDLEYWLKEYTLGEFAFSGALEAVE
jgi:predicted ATPase